MAVIGAITRLTESGLSITEWAPVTGVIPPLNEAQWMAEFDKYRQIPEYQQINRGMSLEAFKVIYFWEWFHRLWGRLIGVAFLVPFLWFLARRRVPEGYGPRLWLLFGLGGLQRRGRLALGASPACRLSRSSLVLVFLLLVPRGTLERGEQRVRARLPLGRARDDGADELSLWRLDADLVGLGEQRGHILELWPAREPRQRQRRPEGVRHTRRLRAVRAQVVIERVGRQLAHAHARAVVP